MRPQSLSPPFRRSKVVACTAIGIFTAPMRVPRPCCAQERDRAAGGVEPEQRAAREQHGIDAGYRHLRVEQRGVAGAGRAAAGDAGGDVGGVEDDRGHAGGDARVLGIADTDAGDVGDEVERAQAFAPASRIVLPTQIGATGVRGQRCRAMGPDPAPWGQTLLFRRWPRRGCVRRVYVESGASPPSPVRPNDLRPRHRGYGPLFTKSSRP